MIKTVFIAIVIPLKYLQFSPCHACFDVYQLYAFVHSKQQYIQSVLTVKP